MLDSIAFVGGRVETMDPAVGPVEVVVTSRDRIAAVGGRELLPSHPDATVVDLAGAVLAPGLIDAHNHLSIAALQPRWLDVSHIADRDELVTSIRDQAEREPTADWIRCHGWDEHHDGLAPTRHDLDAAGIDRPVIVVHQSLHQCVVSSAGLAALEIGAGTPDPQGGEILRGSANEPTGVLLERAWGQAHARSLEAYAEPDRWAEHIAARATSLLADGITCVHDAACSPQAEAVYRSMAAGDRLPFSVLALPHAEVLLSNDIGARLHGPPTGDGDERFRVGPLKLFADGGLAIALDVTIDHHPVRYGMLMDDLHDRLLEACDHGFRVAVHAIGNLAVDAALEAFAAAARSNDGDHRFRIEHAGVTAPAQWGRLAALGAVAVVQPGFVEHVGEQTAGVEFDDHRWLAFAGLREAGVLLAGSSDDPCAPVSPLWAAHKGATRRTDGGLRFGADQAVPLEEWLVAYTRGAAYAGGQEQERGTITPGKRADLVVLEGLPGHPTVATGTGELRVVQTWVGGARVFERSAV